MIINIYLFLRTSIFKFFLLLNHNFITILKKVFRLKCFLLHLKKNPKLTETAFVWWNLISWFCVLNRVDCSILNLQNCGNGFKALKNAQYTLRPDTIFFALNLFINDTELLCVQFLVSSCLLAELNNWIRTEFLFVHSCKKKKELLLHVHQEKTCFGERVGQNVIVSWTHSMPPFSNESITPNLFKRILNDMIVILVSTRFLESLSFEKATKHSNQRYFRRVQFGEA